MISQKTILSQRPSRRRPERRSELALRFTPTAWAKLLFLRDAGDTEVGGFAISAVDELLLIEDVELVTQVCDMASVLFEDASVADYLDRQVDAGVSMARCARIWVHTHPGESPQPSGTDEETFARVFGATDWALMFILARGGRTYARLRFHVGPGGDIELPVVVDYSRPFAASDHEAWLAEYSARVRQRELLLPAARDMGTAFDPFADDWLFDWDRHGERSGFLEEEEPSRAAQ